MVKVKRKTKLAFIEYYNSKVEEYKKTYEFIKRKPVFYLILAVGDGDGAIKESFAKILIRKKGVEELIEKGIFTRHQPDKTTLLLLTEKGWKTYKLLKELHEILSK